MMKKILSVLTLFSTQALLGISPHVYVADQIGTTVQIIDVNQGEYVGISGFDRPHTVKITPDGRQAYVVELSGHVRAIDTITHTILPMTLDVFDPLAIA